MAKGSGLSIDPDPIGLFIHKPRVLNSFQQNHEYHNHHKINNPYAYSMDATIQTSPPRTPTIQFPVNLINCRTNSLPAPSDHDKRKEMDFFRDNNKTIVDHNDLNGETEIELKVNTGLHLLTTNTSSDQSMLLDEGVSTDKEDKKPKSELAVLQDELNRMKEENHRLKQTLSQVTNKYNSLQMHIHSLMQTQKAENINSSSEVEAGKLADNMVAYNSNERRLVARQFMDLGLGSTDGGEANELSSSSEERRSVLAGKPNGHSAREDSPADPDHQSSQGNWVKNKVTKTTSSDHQSAKDNDQTEATMRKARVAVRARSEAPMIADGCQWRKYGQKIAKGNPCPRAYYRCTMAVGCPVRKQVQRCAEDQTILVTTYEGNHNHPLPPPAMAMASTTSSAARMLLSGSVSSTDGTMNPNFQATTMLPCSSSMATISASPPFPTVTLDLTQSPNPLHHLQKQPVMLPFHVSLPSNPPSQGLLPHVFTQGQALYNNNQSKFSGLQVSQENNMAAAVHTGPNANQSVQQCSLADSVTAAITADPNFTAALAAAISSIITGAHQSNVSNNVANLTTSNNNNNNNINSNNGSNGNATASNSN